MAKVTVIVAIYNVAAYLEKCIKSVIAQTYRDIEIILVNDGSTDECLNICHKFEKKDRRIKVINQKNQGVSVARNNGLDNATGEYIMFVDGDDFLQKNIVEVLLKNVGNNDIIICSYKAFDNDNKRAENCHFFGSNKDFSESKTELYLQLINLSYGQSGNYYTAVGVPWGKLYKRSFLENNNLRFDKKLIRMQDNIFNMQAFALASGIIYIDMPLYMYRLNNILSYKKLPYKPEYLISILQEREKLIKKFGLDKEKDISDFFAEEVLLCSLKTIIYISRTEKMCNFRKTAEKFLSYDIYSRYKNQSIFVSKRSFIITLFMKLGLNPVTYFIAKYVPY